MTDSIRKTAMINTIESLQLPTSLISALDHAQQADQVVEILEALASLELVWY